MGFVNRLLKEEERRTYVFDYPQKGRGGAIIGGTIDDENDVRLFCYANGPIGKREPCDVYSFIFDYKKHVFYVHLRKSFSGQNEVHWEFAYPPDKEKLTEEQLQSLRDGMKAFAYEGFDMGEINRKNREQSYIEENERHIILIEF